MVKLMLISDTHYGMDGKTNNVHLKFWKKVKAAIKKENVQVLIWAGDLASTRLRNFRQSIEMATQYVSIPIVLVRGNHDFWDGEDKKDKGAGTRSLEQLMDHHQHIMKVNGIHHLEGNPFIIDDVIICGFDGWYAVADPATNDKQWMPHTVAGEAIVSSFLTGKAWKDVQNCLDTDTSEYRKSVLVTHHNPYPYAHSPDVITKPVDEMIKEGVMYTGHGANIRFLPEIREKFDVLCCGHTHVYKNDTREGIQIYNCGSDYNKPKYLIFEV